MKVPKHILLTAKFLQFISPNLAKRFAAKLFITPKKHKMPKREWHMDKNSTQSKLYIPSINKHIHIYEYGEGIKKILLVHGWSGRGTQTVKIADELIKNNYKIISFDAPAHGKSHSKTTIMTEFIASIHQIDKTFGSFESIIGHSLGGMSIINAIKDGLIVDKGIIIGSGDLIQDIINDFIEKLKLKHKISVLMKDYLEKKLNQKMEYYATSEAAKSISIPILIIHDKHDIEVSVKAAHNIYNNIKNSKLILTEGLGHRKILGDDFVIQNILKFIKS